MKCFFAESTFSFILVAVTDQVINAEVIPTDQCVEIVLEKNCFMFVNLKKIFGLSHNENLGIY